jgi:hypothetical protein
LPVVNNDTSVKTARKVPQIADSLNTPATASRSGPQDDDDDVPNPWEPGPELKREEISLARAAVDPDDGDVPNPSPKPPRLDTDSDDDDVDDDDLVPNPAPL